MIDIPDSVFPSNTNGDPICPKCRKDLTLCDCPSFDPTQPKKDLYEQTAINIRN